jgi:hypothetical protein
VKADTSVSAYNMIIIYAYPFLKLLRCIRNTNKWPSVYVQICVYMPSATVKIHIFIYNIEKYASICGHH